MLQRLTQGLEFHTQALVLRAERQRVIASNIANADTPGFKARDMDFAATLRQATASLPGVAVARTSGADIGRDIARGVAADLGRGSPITSAPTRLRYAVPSQTHLDSNTVDMDRERAAFADNAVKFESTLRFINGSVRTLQDAMKSPQHG
jgi:flagellar basal-body rod protein FlgB